MQAKTESVICETAGWMERSIYPTVTAVGSVKFFVDCIQNKQIKLGFAKWIYLQLI